MRQVGTRSHAPAFFQGPLQMLGVLGILVFLWPSLATAQQADALVVDELGNLGLGTEVPERQLHVSGPNAVVRLDRPRDATTFMMVRTDFDGNIWKTFSVGTRASGPNVGEFVIQDFGQQVGGDSIRRMTINNDGNVIFGGTVTSASSARYKQDIRTLSGAGVALEQLRAVRYVRKGNGREEIGLIAEEVADVYPELVEHDSATGDVEAVNYSGMVAVLLEAFKEQQALVLAQQDRISSLEAELSSLAREVDRFTTPVSR